MTDAEIVRELRAIKFAARFLEGEDVPAMVDALIARLSRPEVSAWPPPGPQSTPERLPTYLRFYDGT